MSLLSALFARRLTPPVPSARPSEEQRADWHTALCAVQRLYADQVTQSGERHVVLASRYDQIIRLLLADSVNIRVQEDEE